MRADSIDLRQGVVAAHDAGQGSQEQLAARFAVNIRLDREAGRQLNPKRLMAKRKPPVFTEGHP